MAGSTFARLGELASQRWGLVTTAQALEAGVARPTLTRLANSGALIRVARMYRQHPAPTPIHDLLDMPAFLRAIRTKVTSIF